VGQAVPLCWCQERRGGLWLSGHLQHNQAGHLLPPSITGGQQQPPLSGNMAQHGPPQHSMGNQHPTGLGAGNRGTGGEGQQGKGTWPGSRRTSSGGWGEKHITRRWEMGRAAPRCPRSRQHPGRDAAATDRARGTLCPPCSRALLGSGCLLEDPMGQASIPEPPGLLWAAPTPLMKGCVAQATASAPHLPPCLDGGASTCHGTPVETTMGTRSFPALNSAFPADQQTLE